MIRLFRLIFRWGAPARPVRPVPASRTYVVAAESRAYAVAAESRAFVVPAETRTFVA